MAADGHVCTLRVGNSHMLALRLLVQFFQPAVTRNSTPYHTSIPSSPRPAMIPAVPRRKINLVPRIFDRYAPPNPPLGHGASIQPANLLAPRAQSSRVGTLSTGFTLARLHAILVQQSKMFARFSHRIVLSFQLALLGQTALPQE